MNSLSVAVVGTGLMGKGIGHTFAAHNCKVYMYGRSPNHQDKMYEYLDHEVEKNKAFNKRTARDPRQHGVYVYSRGLSSTL